MFQEKYVISNSLQMCNLSLESLNGVFPRLKSTSNVNIVDHLMYPNEV